MLPNSRYVTAQNASGKSLIAIVDKESDSLICRCGAIVLTYSISFFLGAGASNAFGYPTTTGLKKSSIEYVTNEANSTYDPNRKTRLLTMLPLLKHRGFPDIEYIFQLLKEASKKNIPEVYNFFTSNIFLGQLEAMSRSVTEVEAGKYFEYCDFLRII